MKKYIMALDEGTTSLRTIIFDKQGNEISVGRRSFEQIFPHSRQFYDIAKRLRYI